MYRGFTEADINSFVQPVTSGERADKVVVALAGKEGLGGRVSERIIGKELRKKNDTIVKFIVGLWKEPTSLPFRCTFFFIIVIFPSKFFCGFIVGSSFIFQKEKGGSPYSFP